MNEISAAADAPPVFQDQPRCAGRYWPAIAVFLGVCLTVLAADQTLKYVSFQMLSGGQIVHDPGHPEAPLLVREHPPVTVIPHILSLKLTANPGAVFGIGAGQRWLFVIISLIATVVVLAVFYRSKPRAWLNHVALGLILAGALGNLYDRIVFAAVRDMLWLLPGTGLWPWVFNIADVSLLTGVGLMLLVIWDSERPRQADQTNDD